MAPQVSDDDDTSGAASVSSSSEATSSMAMTVTPTTTASTSSTVSSIANAKMSEIPILPKLSKSSLAKPGKPLSPKKKRSSPTKATSPPAKKAKAVTLAATTMIKKETEATAPPSTAIPAVDKTPDPLIKAKSVESKPATTTGTNKANTSAPTTTVPEETISAKAAPTTDAASIANTDDEDCSTATGSHGGKMMTDEDRAKQCRDRNRQHARNTRLRKKAYVEELKNQLRDMVDARDLAALEDAQKTKIAEQQREVRFQVMQDFLQLRGRNEGNPHRWAAILEEGFTLTMPMTHFQNMVNQDDETNVFEQTEQVLHGVPDIMSDSTYFASFLQTLGSDDHHHHTATTTNSPHTTAGGGDDTNIPSITFTYHCDRKNFLMDGCNAILSWNANSTGAVRQVRHYEQALQIDFFKCSTWSLLTPCFKIIVLSNVRVPNKNWNSLDRCGHNSAPKPIAWNTPRFNSILASFKARFVMRKRAKQGMPCQPQEGAP